MRESFLQASESRSDQGRRRRRVGQAQGRDRHRSGVRRCAGGLFVIRSVSGAIASQAAPALSRRVWSWGLTRAEAFYGHLRASDLIFGERLTPGQFAGIEADLAVGAGRLPMSWMAYALATDYHETGHSMQPCRERGNGDGPDADPWDDYLEQYDTGRKAAALGNTPEADGDGILWMGRGKAQITGARNYRFANTRLHELGVLATIGSHQDAGPGASFGRGDCNPDLWVA